MADHDHRSSRGPFRSDQLPPGTEYELSHGHPVHCLPTGGRGAGANALGVLPLATDPDAVSAGVDAGFSPYPGMLRAPDIAVGNVPNEPGWVHAVPPLAVEYADTGQDERELTAKIAELLDAGTRHVWVVRLTGPRRVEVHEPGVPVRTVLPGQHLHAAGTLKNPVLVEALYEPEAAMDAALTNLLQRRGYESLAALREQSERTGIMEGKRDGIVEGILRVLEARAIPASPALESRVRGCRDQAVLERWLVRAATAASAADAIDD